MPMFFLLSGILSGWPNATRMWSIRLVRLMKCDSDGDTFQVGGSVFLPHSLLNKNTVN